jgi:hypothetical protein
VREKNIENNPMQSSRLRAGVRTTGGGGWVERFAKPITQGRLSGMGIASAQAIYGSWKWRMKNSMATLKLGKRAFRHIEIVHQQVLAIDGSVVYQESSNCNV